MEPVDDAARFAGSERARDEAMESLSASELAVFGLPERFQPAQPRLARWGGVDAAVTTVTVDYDELGTSGMWATVTTSRWSGTAVESADLETVLAEQVRARQMSIPTVTSAAEPVVMLVNGVAVAGTGVRGEGGFWAARCETGGIEVTVAAYRWEPEQVAVETVQDRTMLLAQYAAGLPAVVDVRSGAQQPGGESGAETEGQVASDPIRRLIDVNVAASIATAEWMRAGGPAPQQIDGLTGLWTAAVGRYIALTDADEPQARLAVARAIDQMMRLVHECEWFVQQPQLRFQAVSETLLFTTGLGLSVPSAQAQRAWVRLHGLPPEVSSEVLWDAQTSWRTAWNEWAGLPDPLD